MGLPPYLCVHGHFYQPPRENPFAGIIPREYGADPYDNFNEKITAECYRPNADLGNFSLISFNVGPTLAAWLRGYDPRTYDAIIEADRRHFQADGYGNALAQAYNHTILPLGNLHEKRIQIAWGVADFRRRYGHDPEGMWLAETAVDLETLEVMSEFGLKFTILAPWQASGNIDPSEPYLVRLPSGRSIVACFFDNVLSAGVSFDENMTSDAKAFSRMHLPRRLNKRKLAEDEPQFILIATDGEVYGHHKPWRDRFLQYLLNVAAPSDGFQVEPLSRYLHLHPPTREVTIKDRSAWSCHHGVERWQGDCPCCDGDGTWKTFLRRALDRLAEKMDYLYARQTLEMLRDPWQALEDYINLRDGAVNLERYWERHGTAPLSAENRSFVLTLLEAEYYRQLMFTSCAFFFEDLDRIEPRNSIADAARAIDLIRRCGETSFEDDLIRDLHQARSWRTHRTGADIYKEVVANARLSAVAD
ncbi:MAG: DUF3536 domain-containing protein [Chloroflexi bacterium]|nr:DUF3536 domain-containing protein [Chloroflexota bacterium]